MGNESDGEDVGAEELGTDGREDTVEAVDSVTPFNEANKVD